MSDRFPVFVSVTRDDGRVEQVRVGTAVKSGEGFSLQFDALSIGGTAMSGAARAPAASSRSSGGAARAGGGDGTVFPPYGRSKGQPVYGASMQDLQFYASGCNRTLNDPSKSRWHDKERVLLAAIEAEIARQEGGGGGGSAPSDDGIPPPTDDDAPF